MNEKIFIVEDDEDIRAAYTKLFKLKGFTVESASNGKEAFEKLSSKDQHELPDCILVDLMMPVMSGQEFLSKIQDLNNPLFARVPIIITTALSKQETSYQFKLNIKTLYKPIRLKNLLDEVYESIGRGPENLTI
ncbi:MAG: response regulator [Bacteriovoracaceae bacterium]|nr:response regulator [Bacteriovoracaceae bacterium]